MRIELGCNANFDQISKCDCLNQKEQEQLTNLFKKIVQKGYLGNSGSGQLSFLLRKLDDPSLYLKFLKDHTYQLTSDRALFVEAEINEREPEKGHTKLHLAINTFDYKNLEASREKIKILLAQPGIDVNLTDNQGWSIAYQATQLTDPEALELIFSAPGLNLNMKNLDKSVPLIRAADRNNIPAVEALLKRGVDVNRCNDTGTALSYAVRKNHLHVCDLLIKNKADVNLVSDSLGKTPLKLAKEKGSIELVKLLEAAGAIEEPQPTPIQKKVQEGGEELRKFLAADPNVKDQYGRNAAHYWANSPNEETRQILEAAGVDFKALDNLKRTPMHYAAMVGESGAVKFLIEKQVDVDHQDKHGYSALSFAAQYDHLGVAQLLVDSGVNYNHMDKYGWTPLTKAADAKSEKVCEFLCQLEGIDVNQAQPLSLSTPLHRASISGSPCVAILLKYGADPFLRDQQNKTAEDYCVDPVIRELFHAS